MLSANGTEFTNKLFAQVASTLGVKQEFSLPYYSQGNGGIENVHDFCKTCIRKHVFLQLA